MKLRKPPFDVSAKSISLKSLASVKQYHDPETKSSSKGFKAEYKPPKKIGDTLEVISLEAMANDTATSKLPPTEEQLIGVLGYMQTLWKNSSFVKPVDRTSVATSSGIRLSQNDDDESIPRVETPIIIANELTGLDLRTSTLKASGDSSQSVAARREDKSPSPFEPAKVIKAEKAAAVSEKVEKPLKSIVKVEEPKEDPKVAARRKLLEGVMGKIPDLEYLLAKTVVKIGEGAKSATSKA